MLPRLLMHPCSLRSLSPAHPSASESAPATTPRCGIRAKQVAGYGGEDVEAVRRLRFWIPDSVAGMPAFWHEKRPRRDDPAPVLSFVGGELGLLCPVVLLVIRNPLVEPPARKNIILSVLFSEIPDILYV